MNSKYIDEYIALLERVIAVAYERSYSLISVERAISRSPFFQTIEKDHIGFAPITTDVELVKQIYANHDIDLSDIPYYKQCLWVSEAYLRILEKTKLTFEAIFLYIPIKRMFAYYHLYHEMDFTQIVDEFLRLYNDHSILDLLIKSRDYSLKEISNMINVSYDTLFSYKQRRRDIKKMEVQIALELANILRVRIETLIETTN